MLKAQPELEGFTDTALPKTMTVARRYRTPLQEHLLAPVDWTFEDRVFVLAAPTWEVEVRTYYINGADGVADRCESQQRSRLEWAVGRQAQAVHRRERTDSLRQEQALNVLLVPMVLRQALPNDRDHGSRPLGNGVEGTAVLHALGPSVWTAESFPDTRCHPSP